MLQTHVNNDIYNKYCLIHNKIQRQDLQLKKLLKGLNSGKNQSSMTSIKYDHLQVMGTVTGKFH